jgi:hypothetical protein
LGLEQTKEYIIKNEASMISETRTAYLFHCRCDDLFAVSHDMTGANIPRTTCTDG